MRNRQHEIQHVSWTITSFSGLLGLHTETFYSTFHATLAARLPSSYFYVK